MKRYSPGWKDSSGNRYVFTNKNMIFNNQNKAVEKSISLFLAMLPAGLFNGGVVEFDMDRLGNIALEGIEANFGRVGTGYLISGPKFDELKSSAATTL